MSGLPSQIFGSQITIPEIARLTDQAQQANMLLSQILLQLMKIAPPTTALISAANDAAAAAAGVPLFAYYQSSGVVHQRLV